ncbi:MAG: hypothetical protein QOH88_2236 [Verrucomicrobiota bacterium]|jgi:hypothetical protein
MDENLQEDWLDARLREDAAYIDDAGFTAGVLQKLPARPVGHSLRAVILLGVTAVACIVAYLLSGGGWLVAESVTRFAMLPTSIIWSSAAVVSGLVMAGGLAAAMSRFGGRSR